MPSKNADTETTFGMVRKWFETNPGRQTSIFFEGGLHEKIKKNISTWYAANKGVQANAASAEVRRCIVACSAIALQDPFERNTSRTVPGNVFSDDAKTELAKINDRSFLYIRINVIHALVLMKENNEKIPSTGRLKQLVQKLKKFSVFSNWPEVIREPLILLSLWSLCGIARSTKDSKKRYKLGMGNQLLVPWRRNELEAEVVCLEEDLRFMFIMPNSEITAGIDGDAFLRAYNGVLNKFARRSDFDSEQIALFESFVHIDSQDSNEVMNDLAAHEGSEGYILDKLFVRVLQIKLSAILDESEIALLGKDEDVDAFQDYQKVPAKVGVHFSEHFGLKNTKDAKTTRHQLFKKINNI